MRRKRQKALRRIDEVEAELGMETRPFIPTITACPYPPTLSARPFEPVEGYAPANNELRP